MNGFERPAAPVRRGSRDAGAMRRFSIESEAAKYVPRTMAEDCARRLDSFRLGSSNAMGLVTAHGQRLVAY